MIWSPRKLYDYVSSIEKLDENVLPPKEAFYNKLNKSNISDKKYNMPRTCGMCSILRR
jgi:hypothetical protein